MKFQLLVTPGFVDLGLGIVSEQLNEAHYVSPAVSYGFSGCALVVGLCVLCDYLTTCINDVAHVVLGTQ